MYVCTCTRISNSFLKFSFISLESLAKGYDKSSLYTYIIHLSVWKEHVLYLKLNAHIMSELDGF